MHRCIQNYYSNIHLNFMSRKNEKKWVNAELTHKTPASSKIQINVFCLGRSCIFPKALCQLLFIELKPSQSKINIRAGAPPINPKQILSLLMPKAVVCSLSSFSDSTGLSFVILPLHFIRTVRKMIYNEAKAIIDWRKPISLQI